MTLAVVAQWIECWPVNQRVAGSVPSLGHMPVLWARSPVGSVREATNISPTSMCLFLFFPSLPSPLSKKMNKIFLKIESHCNMINVVI